MLRSECLTETTVIDLLADRLAARERAAADAHARECAACRQLVDELRACEGALLADAVQAPWALPADLVVEDRYLVLARLGQGGMGEVFSAYDPRLDRKVAVKLLRARSGSETAELERRLVREAKALAQLSHPNVVSVHDVGAVGEQVFVAMELIDGRTLRAWVDEDRPGWSAIVAAYRSAGEGLAAAHEVGIVHRDFKPENALIDRSGRVRVVDFGLSAGSGGGLLGAAVTDQGAMRTLGVGTPAYMAPEQRLDQPVGAAADQFSFCVSLSEALGDRVPAWIHGVLARGLRIAPDERYPSMRDLLAALAPTRSGWRRWSIAGAVAIGVAALAITAGVVWRRAPAADPCTSAADALAPIWNSAARARIAIRFAGVAVPYAADTATRTSAAIDDWARDWSAMRVDACRATRDRGTQSDALLDRRMRCLDLRLAELRGAIDVFGDRPDAIVVDHAVSTIARLTPLATCADTSALLAEIAPPADPLLRARTGLLGARIAAAKAHIAAGRIKDAPAELAPLVAEARAIGWTPAIARGLFQLGYARYRLGDYAGAERELHDAGVAASEAHDDDLVAQSLRFVAETRTAAGHPDQGLAVARAAEIAAARVAADALVHAQIDDTLGDAYEALARYPEANDAHQRAVTRLEQLRGPEDVELGALLQNAAGTASAAGDLVRAAALEQRALAIFRARLGPDHPFVAAALLTLGSVVLRSGHLGEARQDYEAALAIDRRTLPPDHPSIASILHWVSLIELDNGALADAERDVQAALAIEEKALGPEHRNTLAARNALALVRREQGRLAEALAIGQDVLARQLRTVPPDRRSISMTYEVLASVNVGLGRLDDALAARQHGLAIRDDIFGPDSAEVAETLSGIAEIHVQRGDCTAAAVEARRAMAIYDRSPPPELAARTPAMVVLARCAAGTGDLAGAIATAERVVAIMDTAGRGLGNDFPRLRFELARLFWQAGDHRRARELVQAAITFDAAAGRAPGELAELRAWLAAHSRDNPTAIRGAGR